MKITGLGQFRVTRKGVFVPCLILLGLFVLTWFSQATFTTGFEGYNLISQRGVGSFVPNSSDVNVILTILNLNASGQEVEYSFWIQAWLEINMTEINCFLQTSNEFITMKNYGTASYNSSSGEAWGWYYQIENTTIISETANGFSQRYPYDYYSLPISLMFFTPGLEPTFNQTFQPTVVISVMSSWNTETYSKPIDVSNYGFRLDIGVVVSRDTVLSVLQLMIPTMAIYLLMGCSLLVGTNDDKLQNRITLFLTIAVLTLAFYTFLLGQIGFVPLFMQSLIISLVISNVILVVFSIVSSSQNRRSRNWDLVAMTLVSLTPVFYLLLSAYNLANPYLKQVPENVLWQIQNLVLAYVDYRFLIWLVIFQLAFWSAYLYKGKAIAPVTFITGVGILFLNYSKDIIFKEIAFSIVGVALIVISSIWLIRSFLRKRPDQSSDFKYCV